MKKVVVLMFGAAMLLSAEAANKSPDVQEILALSKMTGVCGVAQQMVSFQIDEDAAK
jgi:hypothetical protein